MSGSVRELRSFVAGGYVGSTSETRCDLVDPSTGEVVARAPVSSDADVDAAYAAAAEDFEVWGRTTPSQRQRALLRFADALQALRRAGQAGGREHRQAARADG